MFVDMVDRRVSGGVGVVQGGEDEERAKWGGGREKKNEMWREWVTDLLDNGHL